MRSLSPSLFVCVCERERLRARWESKREYLSLSLSERQQDLGHLSLVYKYSPLSSAAELPGYEIMPLFFSEITGTIFFIGLLTSSVNYRLMR